ncbi:Uncharacterised protein [Chryseobacterium taihuense]|uniref:Uncharacterized protein n=1 Tax=Chryseobacterium taihuense TaxID=1141221 RepID=A0A1G9M3A4_9FLAO|nr:hypothetical protein SAMN05216273_104182 [Chryseobacterium taihuense]VFB05319.1 Uncharacterised protein [Chryseobacterium taihuense]
MSKELKILWFFYRKLLIPGVLFSFLLSLMIGFNIKIFGLSFMLLFPFLHYFIYELRFRNEYVFYANFGFSRIYLWKTTIIISVVLSFVTSLL